MRFTPTQHVNHILELEKTIDQLNAMKTFINAKKADESITYQKLNQDRNDYSISTKPYKSTQLTSYPVELVTPQVIYPPALKPNQSYTFVTVEIMNHLMSQNNYRRK